jgi:hypothetical protein
MGLSVVLVFERSFPTPPRVTNGELLAESFGPLDDIAHAVGLRPMSSFGDNRDVPQDFEGPPEALNELLGPCTDWYDAGIGASALLAIGDAITSRPDVAQDLEDPLRLAAELGDLARLLETAAAHGVRFRLELR